jgi:hypothetical protein
MVRKEKGFNKVKHILNLLISVNYFIFSPVVMETVSPEGGEGRENTTGNW